jgi:lipoprotein-releasing system permease protein
MTFELFVSLRYLLAKRRQTFISLVTMISIAGVAVGVTALIVVLAVMNGFQADWRTRILGITSNIVVGSYVGTVSDYDDLIKKIDKEPGVVAATPFIYSQIMLSSSKNVSGAILRGIDPRTAPAVINIQKNMIRGNLGDLESGTTGSAASMHPGIILGSELANNLGARPGEMVTVVSPVGRLTPMGQVPKSRIFKVAGIFQSGLYEFDNTMSYVDLGVAQQFLGIGDAVTGIEVKVRDIYDAGRIAEELRARLGPPYWVRDWMQMNQTLFSALKLEKTVMFIILTLIVLVAAFNIVSSLIMLVMEKTRDIAIMKAMGATTARVRKIFVLEGFMIGVSGTILGLIGGYTLCRLLEQYHFIKLPPSIYNITTLPVKLEASDVAVIATSAILISLLATVYPSRQAAKLDPAEALRYE